MLPDAASLDGAMPSPTCGDAARADAEALSVHVPDGTAAAVRELLEAMAGVPVVRVAVHRPTLDDVFLALTETTPGTVPA